MSSPAFSTKFEPDVGVAVTVAPGLVRVTAPNGSPYTFTGTNSFLVGHERVAIIDPGPKDEAHLEALERAVAGRPVEAIILTHTHRDHSEAAREAMARFKAPLWSNGPHRLSRPLRRFEFNPLRRSGDFTLVPDRVLGDGEEILGGDVALRVHTTPGHCANHLAFGLSGTEVLLSGDHVMGWNSTLVSTPDGSMADYFASLEKVIALPYRRYVPSHGGPIANGPAHAAALKLHREGRNGQVVAAVKAGAKTIGQVVAQIYPPQSPKLRMAARMTITAHVEYLAERGDIAVHHTPFRSWLSPA